MARLFLDERNLRDSGIHEQNILTLRKLTEFLNLVTQVQQTEEALAAQEAALDAAQEAIEDAELSLTSLDGRVDILEAANLNSRLGTAEGDIDDLEADMAAPITVDANAVKNIVFAGAGVSVGIAGDTATVTIA